jgi:hypothetical protein
LPFHGAYAGSNSAGDAKSIPYKKARAHTASCGKSFPTKELQTTDERFSSLVIHALHSVHGLLAFQGAEADFARD